LARPDARTSLLCVGTGILMKWSVEVGASFPFPRFRGCFGLLGGVSHRTENRERPPGRGRASREGNREEERLTDTVTATQSQPTCRVRRARSRCATSTHPDARKIPSSPMTALDISRYIWSGWFRPDISPPALFLRPRDNHRTSRANNCPREQFRYVKKRVLLDWDAGLSEPWCEKPEGCEDNCENGGNTSYARKCIENAPPRLSE
jgi:hypothetical protein